MTLRTIVVDDSIIFRKVMRDALKDIPNVEVVDIARDGSTAIEKIASAKPDLVTLDIEMPGLNGLQVLEELEVRGIKTNVIVVSAHTRRGAETTTQALAMGALDFILKPNGDSSEGNSAELRSELSRLVNMVKSKVGIRGEPVAQARRKSTSPSIRQKPESPATPIVRPKCLSGAANYPRNCRAIFLGISTGGPKALAEVIPKVQGSLSVPIIMVQHMPPLFTATMAKSLDGVSSLSVVEATDRMPLVAGGVYVAPGGKQLAVMSNAQGELIAKVTDEPAIKSCKPSVDHLMFSVPPHIAKESLAIIMTGMGDDGKDGCEQMRKHGAIVWAQSEASCTVYGMPRQIIDNALADHAFELTELPGLLNKLATKQGLATPHSRAESTKTRSGSHLSV